MAVIVIATVVMSLVVAVLEASPCDSGLALAREREAELPSSAEKTAVECERMDLAAEDFAASLRDRRCQGEITAVMALR